MDVGDVRVLVLRAAGINCDEEVMHCWRLAGGKPVLIHINRLAENVSILDDVHIVTLPGGFSYGDDIAAGRILALRVLLDLEEPLRSLVERGGGILGICNGFQTLVKTGFLPGGGLGRDKVTVTYNDSARFEARWVKLRVCTDRCPFLTPISPSQGSEHADEGTDSWPREYLELPVEHAEGKVVTADDGVVRTLENNGLIALRYVDENGRHDTYPANPNGSVAGIAGLCDPTGRILGLMPHPDRYFDHTHHPRWTCLRPTDVPDGLTLFKNAVAYWSDRSP